MRYLSENARKMRYTGKANLGNYFLGEVLRQVQRCRTATSNICHTHLTRATAFSTRAESFRPKEYNNHLRQIYET
jgi:hypothetical protein